MNQVFSQIHVRVAYLFFKMLEVLKICMLLIMQSYTNLTYVLEFKAAPFQNNKSNINNV
jgi:hypothetical protein